MSDLLRISEVRFHAAPVREVSGGMLGWVAFVLGSSVRVDSVGVRRTRDGRLALAFPSRRSRVGIEHSLIAPLTDAVREEIEQQVFAELHLRGAVP